MAFKLNNLNEVHHVGAKLGKGAFAQVKLVKHKSTDQLMALKVIDLTTSTNYQSEIGQIMTECKTHKSLHHPNIIRLHDYLTENRQIYLLMEFAAKGDYYKYFKSSTGPLSEVEVAHCMFQLLNALAYIHEKDIIHRDIKLENILINEDQVIKLCDFGWCSPPGDNARNILCGTYEYMAPEVIKRQFYNHSIDVWSVGVLMYELLHRYTPFKGPDVQAICRNITNGTFYIDSHIGSDFRHLITSCLKQEPNERPSVKQLLENKAFSSVREFYYSRKSVRPSLAPGVNRSTLGADMFASNNFGNEYKPQLDAHRHTGFPEGSRFNKAAATTSALDCTLLRRLDGLDHDGEKEARKPIAKRISMIDGTPRSRDQLSNRPTQPKSQFDSPEPEWVPHSEGNDMFFASNQYSPAKNLNSTGMAQYNPTPFEADFDNRPSLKLSNAGDYFDFDIDIKDIYSKVVGSVGNWFTDLHGTVMDTDNNVGGKSKPIANFNNDPRSQNGWGHTKRKVSQTNRDAVMGSNTPRLVLPSETTDGSTKPNSVNIEPSENMLPQPIKCYNFPPKDYQQEVKPARHKSKSRPRKQHTQATEPLRVDPGPMSVHHPAPRKLSLPDCNEEPSMFDQVLGFFGFGSETQEYKVKVIEQKKLRDEQRHQRYNYFKDEADIFPQSSNQKPTESGPFVYNNQG